MNYNSEGMQHVQFAATTVQEKPIERSVGSGRWMVMLYNNDWNTQEEVVAILIKATGCDLEEAYLEMWEAHTYGKAPVHFGADSECREVSEVLGTIGLFSEVVPEWQD